MCSKRSRMPSRRARVHVMSGLSGPVSGPASRPSRWNTSVRLYALYHSFLHCFHSFPLRLSLREVRPEHFAQNTLPVAWRSQLGGVPWFTEPKRNSFLSPTEPSGCQVFPLTMATQAPSRTYTEEEFKAVTVERPQQSCSLSALQAADVCYEPGHLGWRGTLCSCMPSFSSVPSILVVCRLFWFLLFCYYLSFHASDRLTRQRCSEPCAQSLRLIPFTLADMHVGYFFPTALHLVVSAVLLVLSALLSVCSFPLSRSCRRGNPCCLRRVLAGISRQL
jgi:hypothetical protein